MKSILIVTSSIFLLIQLSWSGQIKTWTDEEGVTHIELEGYQTQKSSLSKPKRSNKPDRLEDEYQRKVRNLNIEQRKERGELDNELKEAAYKRELERAKKDYEYLKDNESKYRQYYHETKSPEYREYWYNKMQEVDEARSKYFKLLNNSP